MIVFKGVTYYTTKEVCAATHLARSTVKNIAKRGYFVLEHNFIRRDTVTSERIQVNCWRNNGNLLFPQESLDNLLDGVLPNLEGWPTAKQVAARYSISATQISEDFNKGKIYARKSIMKRELFLPRESIREFVLDSQYNLEECRKKMGLVNHLTFWRWQRDYGVEFISYSRGRRAVIRPHILGRLKMLKSFGDMDKEKMSHLLDSNDDFYRYFDLRFRNRMRYDHENPPYSSECSAGMGFLFLLNMERGKINDVSQKDNYIEVEFPGRENIDYRIVRFRTSYSQKKQNP